MLQLEDVILRKATRNDRYDLSVLANNKKIFDNLRDMMPYPYTLKDAEYFIDLIQDENPINNFAITFQYKFCGMIGVRPMTDVYRYSAEIGYWIGEPYWNKGIGTKAIGLCTQYAFDQLKMYRVFANVFEYNTTSIKVLEKNGFTLEGIGKKSVFKNGKIYDDYRYAKTT